MVYRFSWLAGLASLLFAFTGLTGLLRPTSSGTSWQFVVIAALVLGTTITWTALAYRVNTALVVGLNLVALAIAVPRIAAPETTTGLLPTRDTLTALGNVLQRAMELIRMGIEPVRPRPGIVIIVAVVFWIAGALLAWGLMRGHPYVALMPPVVLALQFAIMDRNRTGWLRIAFFLAIVAASIIAITNDERDQAAGRMARAGHLPSLRNRLAPSAAGLLGVTLALSVVATGSMAGLVPYDGVLTWRSATGLTSDFYGGVAYNPFIGIQQQLVSGSSQPVFEAEITGDVPASEVYFRLVTMETYDGGQFFAHRPKLTELDSRPWEDGGNSFAGPTARVTTTVEIKGLRMDWLPETYVPDSFASDEDTVRDIRVRQADGSLRLEGDISYEGLTYTIESVVPRPDIAVLATGDDGQLSPAFAFAATQDQDVPQPVVAATRPEPPNVEKFLEVPEDLNPGIAQLARTQTANLTTNYEIGLALESWFHSPAFRYSVDIDPGHGASDLAAWLLDPESPNYRVGYCENFATAMAIMARTLGVPSRVVLGFTPGEPTGEANKVVIRDRNAHAWVELWLPTQGWVRFDPTPRGDGINPSTFGSAESQLGFSLTTYLDVPDPDVLANQTPPIVPPSQVQEGIVLGGGGSDETTSSGFSIPGWATTAGLYILIVVALVGTVPSIKWWHRRRRMQRLEEGDITAAWEDVVARLTDLGEQPSPAATPRQVAASVDSAMVPLASVYGRLVYGPEDSIERHHVDTAISSLIQTRARLTTRHSMRDRVVAVYRPTSIIPQRMKQAAKRFRGNRRNGNGTG